VSFVSSGVNPEARTLGATVLRLQVAPRPPLRPPAPIKLSRNVLIELLGVFAAGATPWLEALLVVPVGVSAGLPFGAVMLAALSGNVLTIAVAIWFGEAIRDAWVRRKKRRALGRGDPPASEALPPINSDADASAPPGRARRVFERWGLPGLAILGPLGLGTQVSAALAVALGQSRRSTFLWISVSTGVWALVAGVLALGGLRLLGMGT